MRRFASAVAAVAFGFSAYSATAMPVDAGLSRSAPSTTEIRYGCGPNGTRGPYGHCRPRFTCPPGWHPGPYGWHCFRNW